MDGEGGKKFPSQCDLLCKPAEVEQMIQDASSEFRAGGLLTHPMIDYSVGSWVIG